jgi:RNA polymerase sigma-70 factor (ECF subfamily)
MKEFSDNQIFELYQTDKEKAFNILVKKYQERLYWHIRKIVLTHDNADDVLQNTFMKAWRGLEKFNNNSMLYTWLYRIATNEALTHIKKDKSRQNISYSNTEDNNIINLLEEDVYFEGSEFEKKFQLALSKLPEKQRLVFNMKYFDEMKYEQISEVLETSVGGLKASYHHAVNKIKEFLKED